MEYLRECGCRVIEAATTDEAIAILQKTNIPVDVVLSEINMPGAMNGFGFAQWARSVRPELKILLAGTPGRTVRNAAELCEAGPMLMKPYDHKLVLDRIKRLLAARRSRAVGDGTILFAGCGCGVLSIIISRLTKFCFMLSVAQCCVILCAACRQSLSRCCPSSAVIFICCDMHLA